MQTITNDLSNQSTPVARQPFLKGNFAPVERETTLGELNVRGALPRELNGALLRTGPNPATAVPAKHHWFVGDGMLHSIRLEGGRALGYRNRYVRTPRVEQALGLKAAPRSTPAEVPGSGSVNVIAHAGRVLALGEVGLPFEIDRDANTLRQHDFAGALHTNVTAHPKIDPVTGNLYFFGYDFGPVNLRYHVADRAGRLVKTLEIPTRAPTMMHDFAVTATRAIFLDLPVVFDAALIEQGYTMPYRWDETYGARIGVMKRDGDGSDLRWYEIPLCFVYHVFNAYDVGERIVMDVVEHARTFAQSPNGPENFEASPAVRWELDLATGGFERTVIDARGQEFPRIDPRRVTLRHRFGYAVHRPFAMAGQAALLKQDFERGTSEDYVLPAGCAPSEGIFVPIGAGEDEGYVVAPVYNAASDTSEIHVIDAQRWTRGAVAVVELPVRIPFGFHGEFVANH